MVFELVCLGNPLLDLQVQVEPEYLKKYDLKENDAILVDKKHLQIFEQIIDKPGLILLAGGAAQNTARGAQYILPPKSVVYFGSVGKDLYCEKLNEANAQYELETRYQVHDNISTGKCAALITGQHRSLVTDLAAANHFTPDHLEKSDNWSIVENAKFFYIGGFHFTVSPAAIEKLGKHAAENNKVFALNFSAPFIPQFFKDPLDASLPYADFVIANESEAEAYAVSHNLGVDKKDVTAIAKEIAKLPKVNTKRQRTVIFTQGLNPTVAVTYKHDGQFEVNSHEVHEVEPRKVLDTNGAGDAFAAGFMAGTVKGFSLNKSIDLAHWAASLSIQEVGPSFPFPKQKFSEL